MYWSIETKNILSKIKTWRLYLDLWNYLKSLTILMKNNFCLKIKDNIKRTIYLYKNRQTKFLIKIINMKS